MSETNGNSNAAKGERKLADAVRLVKNAAADRDDVVIDMRDAERMRLEILANELAEVIAAAPPEMDIFDFAISSGLQPRFWIDAVSHVAMGRDKRTYRFVRDTRNGRVVLKESADARPVAEAVTKYIAERIVERERMLAGGEPFSLRPAAPNAPASEAKAETKPAPTVPAEPTPPPVNSVAALPAPVATAPAQAPAANGWRTLLWSLAIFLLGGLVGFTLMATQLWEQMSSRLSGL